MNNVKIINLETFLEEMDHDEVVRVVISEIISAIELQIPQMRILLDKREYQPLSREAHSIKGGARNIMAEGLELSSTALEEASTSEGFGSTKLALDKFELEFDNFKKYVVAHSLV